MDTGTNDVKAGLKDFERVEKVSYYDREMVKKFFNCLEIFSLIYQGREQS